MYIAYRKLAHGIAGFVFVTGILLMAFYSGEKEVKNPEPPKTVVKQQSESSMNSTGATVNIPKEEGKSSADKEKNKPKEDFKYKVRSGDNLYDLSITYGVTVDEIVIANNLSTDKLSIGQELLIPVSGKYKDVAALKRVAFNTTDKNSFNVSTTTSRNNKKPAQTSSQNSPEVKATISNTRVGEMIPWSQVNAIFPRGAVATVIDVDTGLTFKVKRFQGTYHADSEPLTTNDTAVLKKIYGGSWSWTRRAVVVIIDGQPIAGSINGMPHGESTIDNNFPGHICIHFKDSTTHGSSYTKNGKPTLDPDHQAMVRKAAGL